MGFYTVLSASVQGLNVAFVQVEADVSNGLPVFHMVGYLSSEVKEAAERVRTAMRNTGFMLPAKKIVVNLSPACVRKRGNVFDLPIAAAVLAALGEIPCGKLKDTLFVGELGLDGKIQPVEGILAIVSEAKEQGIMRCVVPKVNEREGKLVEGIEILGAASLKDLCEWAKGRAMPGADKVEEHRDRMHVRIKSDIDYSEIQGQEGVKRATLIAVAGNHNLLYIGPPGSGKTMMAKRIPTILPELERDESLKITKIYSAAGKVRSEDPLITRRPFREVHHTVTRAALVGGGRIPVPGEVTLANGGVLFLDELAEFPRGVLESLRQPLEDKCIHLVRNHGAYCFPADFMLVAAMNPCPCGYYPDLIRCCCTLPQIQRYLGKISQPFLDRLDVCVEAPKVKYEALTARQSDSDSSTMRSQVEHARKIQERRFRGLGIASNSQMGREAVKEWCVLDTGGERLLRQAYEVMNLTARSFYKTLKVARTIADLAGEEKIREEHIKEAVSYRMIDKKYWGR
ncbi:MAG: YifB family Mg chelatase-like AAA ATPase [Coprococcus sp.]|nr:YifB family Mg chelatase-like AAA ATPase [Coprococcus sp.]